MNYDLNKRFIFSINSKYLLLKGKGDFSLNNKKITKEYIFYIMAQILEFEKKYTWGQMVKTDRHFHRISDEVIIKKCQMILILSQYNPVYQFAIKHEIKSIRVVGFILEGQFFLICIDLDHLLFPKK